MSICTEVFDLIELSLGKILSLRQDFIEKEDKSYVSKGDLLVQSIVMNFVSEKYPEYELISEELAPFKDVKWDKEGSYIVLDPIDGTENFVSGLKEWGVGISVYLDGSHLESGIYLPELNEVLRTGMTFERLRSRIVGLSSSLTRADFIALPESDCEYRVIGCSMYNTLSAVKGSFMTFENVKGVNC